jgi:integrase/recombinase XerD
MKKIISPKITGAGPARLANKLRSLVAADPEIAALDGQVTITIHEAWALDGDRVKVQVELRLPDQSYRMLTRVVSFPLPPEMKVSHRDWTIVVAPSWYGFGWRILDESGAAAGESSEDVGDADYALENARREINRRLAERLTRGTQSSKPLATKTARGHPAPSSVAPPSIPVPSTPPAAQSEETSPATSMELPVAIARLSTENATSEAAEGNGDSLLPAVLAGHHTPGVAARVNRFCLSVGEIFEAWVNRCHSPHTRRAYRADVMSFVEFMDIAWPEASTKMLKVTIADVLDFRGHMLDLGMAPKTILRRISSLSSFYKYLAAAAAEMRLPIVVPNPAHAQFVPRGSADARDETKALTAARARQLMGMPAGDDLVDYRDRAILKVYLYTGVRLTTGCRLKVTDFHQDGGEATLKLHEKGDKRRTIGLHFNAARAIGEYVEKAGVASGPLFRAQAAPRSREKLSDRPMDSATMYRVIQGYLRRLPGAMKKELLEDGAEIEYCIYTPHSLRATTATLLLDAGVDIKKVQDLLGHRHITTTQIYDKRRIAASQSASHDVPI